MNQEIWYTARATYDSEYSSEFSRDMYLKWSKLTHLSELVSLDGLLNGLAFEPDFQSEEDWKYMVTEDETVTQFFNSKDYVLQQTRSIEHFNLLAVIREPSSSKQNLIDEFEFVGYDLVEIGGDISALTNCGGFDESFLPSELNEYGLVPDWERARQIQKDLLANNPDEHHADCFLFEVWRHKLVGRRSSKV